MKRLVTAFVLLVAASIGAIAKACPFHPIGETSAAQK
jgi:hypothetical protein